MADFCNIIGIFAAATSLLANAGIDNVDSNLAKAIRTTVVLIIAWLIVFFRKEGKFVKEIKDKELIFLILSGIATEAS